MVSSRRVTVLVLLVLLLLLPGCGPLVAAKKLAKAAGLANGFSKVGALKKLGFGTGVLLASRTEDAFQFAASKSLDGLDVLCQSQSFLDWFMKPESQHGAEPPAEVARALKRAFPGAEASSLPRQFERGFWAQSVTSEGKRYIIVHNAGQTAIVTEVGKGPPPGTVAIVGVAILFGMVLVLWPLCALVLYFRTGNTGPLGWSRVARAYVAWVTWHPSPRFNAIIWTVGFLALMVFVVYHHFWVKRVVAAPLIRTADQLSVVEWSGQLIKLECEPGPTLARSDEEENQEEQLRVVGDKAVVAQFDDTFLSDQRVLVGYAEPFPPGLVESVTQKTRATPTGKINVVRVDISTGNPWWLAAWFLVAFGGFCYFFKKARKDPDTTTGPDDKCSQAPSPF